MIKAPSLQNEYSLIYSGDPALSLPESEEDRALALKVARETGDWSKLLTGTELPTVFHCGQIKRTERDWILGEVQHSSTLGRPLSAVEMDALVLRVALRKIDGFGSHKVERLKHGASGVWICKPDIIDAIHAEAGHDVIPELAGAIWERATAPLRPL